MNNTEMKEGYAIAVKSWENDGDNYQTRWVYGLTTQECKDIAEVLPLFVSDWDDNNLFGNKERLGTTDMLKDVWDVGSKLVGSWCDGEYWRVYTSHEVYLIGSIEKVVL